MSLMDQAFIKAYAKDSPVVSTPAPTMTPTLDQRHAVAHARPRAATAPSSTTASATTASATTAPASSAGIEQLYCDGALYRIESPAAGANGSAVPAPHYGIKSPKSSRRLGRRQVGNSPAQELPPPPPPTPAGRPSRRGSTRNLHEILRQFEPVAPQSPVPTPPPHVVPVPLEQYGQHAAEQSLAEQSLAERAEPQVEQAPDFRFHEPPKPHKEFAPAPVPPAPLPPPESQPLPELSPATWNHAPQAMPAAGPEVAPAPVDWSQLAASSQVVLPDLGDFAISATDSLLAFEIAPLAEPKPPVDRALPDDSTPAPAEPATGRKFRVDAAHAAVPAPHLAPEAPTWSAHPASEIESPLDVPPSKNAESASPELDLLPLETELQPELEIEPEYEPREYVLAEAVEPTIHESPSHAAAPKKPCVPLWEVDEFIWPATCEKLISDERSYFLQAGGKLLAACKDGLKTLAITGSRRGEGRTTLALCLARCAAKSGLNVAVVDADFARPQLASQVGLEVAYGWQDAALGKIPLAEAAVKSVADNITLLPLEASTAGAALSLSDPRVTATLRAAAATFELVIVDLGPLAGGHEPLFPPSEACPLDACIVVRDLRYATASESQAVGDRLYIAGIEAVGIAENFVQPEA